MPFDFRNELFGPKVKIPDEAKVIFVSDMFVDDYVGGAELTSEALIGSAPFPVYKLHSKDVTLETLEKGQDRFWIFGNFASMDLALIPTIIGNNFKYAICEYDYKYCKYRSPEKHVHIEKKPCDCQNDMHGKLISAFYFAAQSLWWMSEKQRDRYFQMFPFLSERDNTVLSSVFDDAFFVRVQLLKNKHAGADRKKWIVLGSDSWVKGQAAAIEWCTANDKEYEVVWNLPYEDILEKLAMAEGFVYLPAGGDTCPRMVIEAKLLGCKLQLNSNVEHRDEEWFSTNDLADTEAYLFLSRSRFWSGIKHSMEYVATLSGYTTTYNCVSQGYPFRQCIASMLEFCDEVVVVDGGSTDGTLAALEEIAKADSRVKVHVEAKDWSHPRFAVFDGTQKALARSLCTKDFCWQQDSDEVMHPADGPKVREIVSKFPPAMSILALPVIEFWGGRDKIRIDTMPWKWRLSRNDKRITHGIPAPLRKVDTGGNVYASPGTDGCDMIDAETGATCPHGTFYTPDVDMLRQAALQDQKARETYEQWLNAVADQLPCVFHFSWWDIERKVKTYRGYWGKHWKSLYDIEVTDTPENNMMFDKAWKDVTDDDIRERAKLMKDLLGGWIWHAKWDGATKTPHVSINRELPPSMSEWCAEHTDH